MPRAEAGSARKLRELERDGLGHTQKALGSCADCSQAQSELEKRFHERGHHRIEETDVSVSKIQVWLRILISGQTALIHVPGWQTFLSRSLIGPLFLHHDLKANK